MSLDLSICHIDGKHMSWFNWALARGNLSSVLVNNKVKDLPAHPRSLISAFVIRVLKSIISKLATSEISS